MALPAAKQQTASGRYFLHLLFRPAPGRLSQTLCLTIACTIGILIGEIWQLPAMDLIPICLLALWQGDRMMNVTLSMMVFVILAIVPSSLMIAIHLTVNNSFMMLFINLVLAFVFFFLGSASKLKTIAIFMGLIFSYGLMELDTVPLGDAIARFILYLCLLLVIVSAIMILLGLLISPSPRTVLMQRIAYRLRVAAQLLRTPEDVFLHEEATVLLQEGSSGMFANLAMATKEKLWPAQELNRLRQAAMHSFAALAITHAATRHDIHDARETAEQLATLMDDMAALFEAGSCPAEISTPFPDSPALERLAAILRDFAEPSDEKLPSTPKQSGFFLPDAFSNPEHVRFSIKGTLSVLLSMMVYKALDWNGIHTCIITCFLVALPTMGEVIAKQRLRIGGALIGCSLAMLVIVFIMPHLTNIAQLLLMLGVFIFIGGWIKNGDARISYMGLQIGVAFFLSDLTHYTPATDLTVPRDRIIGILIGLFISYMCFTRFWPSSANTHIETQFAQISDLLRAENEAQTPLLRFCMAARVQEAIASTERIIENAAKEPPHYRPSGDALLRYYMGLANATTLMEDLLLPFPIPADPLLADPRFDLLKHATPS